ncbi:gas vesicle protein [Actinorugispora endophytica]|uniref:Gas vesicle protein GvpA/GvpJ/GvpM family n=1 Tax=Actinorugispora endophytica TaxID=1605990 RepID=A0A4R6V988_9ACTN|nr:gas vesicle protein [Actinorugispora endophytica]TDQ55378.1 gas vesicle protein GvpA/GvpJ/GvpM family [Actinorugispora endophytica]
MSGGYAPGPVDRAAAGAPVFAEREVALVDLLDRLLAKGVVISGDVTISIAEVDLVRVSLRALVSSVNEDVPSPWGDRAPRRAAPRGRGR